MAESVKISNLRLIDLEPYVLGKSFTGEAKNVPRLNKDLFEKFLTMLAENEIAKSFFDAYDHYKDFYTTAVDFKALIPKEMQMEVFYAAKNGSYYVEVPSFCVYMVKRAWEQASGMPNMLPKLIPHPVLTEFFKRITSLEVLRSVTSYVMWCATSITLFLFPSPETRSRTSRNFM